MYKKSRNYLLFVESGRFWQEAVWLLTSFLWFPVTYMNNVSTLDGASAVPLYCLIKVSRVAHWLLILYYQLITCTHLTLMSARKSQRNEVRLCSLCNYIFPHTSIIQPCAVTWLSAFFLSFFNSPKIKTWIVYQEERHTRFGKDSSSTVTLYFHLHYLQIICKERWPITCCLQMTWLKVRHAWKLVSLVKHKESASYQKDKKINKS